MHSISWTAVGLTIGLVMAMGGCRDNQPKPPATEQTSGDESQDNEAAKPGDDGPSNPAEGTAKDAEDAIEETQDEIDQTL
jgi:hypothetical protein